ncbi:hypothetical protein EW145_g335 [Phellinidium pouzarii]|uniref:tRNA (guanine(9)-N1)-methyltransferase n=1 Tax=Phellinidium pouzarii TaxID=167371 RepID=A0A4S4LIR0_9AGAM|nr:hypothetical protein EW145_g335 [Phellinidium pouzarii]
MATDVDHSSIEKSEPNANVSHSTSTSADDVILAVSVQETPHPHDSTTAQSAQPLSKKAQKRREKRERAEAGEDGEPRRKKAKRVGSVPPFNARVVVDLGFDDLMSEKEVASLSSQLAYTYNAQRNAVCPFSSLLYTSLNGRLRARLDSQSDAGYRRWSGTEWWEEGYDRLWNEERKQVASADYTGESEENTKKPCRSEKDKVVYLTADADEELEELKEEETYIIGGIVDHNRYKNLCLKKAAESGIRTARLPIGKYLAEMTSRKVLTVNQVFEILVHWVESKNWEEAMYSVMPKRKFEQSNKRLSPEISKEVVVKEDGSLDDEPSESEVGKESES